MSWKKITVPKTVYLPTTAAGTDCKFADTGLRVEPRVEKEDEEGILQLTGDVLEILPGSRRIRVNGKEYNLLISTDSLRLDKNNCLKLDAPAPPVATLSAGGNGRAYVGIGTFDGSPGAAAKAARGDHFWTKNIPSDDHYDDDGEFKGMFQDLHPQNPNQFNPTVLNEERVTRTVTLKDGSTAEVLITPDGRDSGAVSRMYAGEGVRNKSAAQAAYQQQLLLQREVAQPTTAKVVVEAPPAISTVPSAIQDLDGLLGIHLGSPGLPLGTITHMAAPTDLLQPLQDALKATEAPSIEAAFARVHLIKGNPRPLIVIPCLEETPTDAFRLTLAEQLPALAQMIATQPVAIILLTPLWGVKTPALLTYIPNYSIQLLLHPTNWDHIQFIITKGATSPNNSVTTPAHTLS